MSGKNVEVKLKEFREFVNSIISGEEHEIAAEFTERFDRIHGDLRLIDEGTLRISDIVSSMRISSRQDKESAAFTDVIAGLEATLRLVKTNFKTRVAFDEKYDARPLLHAKASQMNQVFMNLLINACHAVDAQSALSGIDYIGRVKAHSKVLADELWVTVSDNGCGMTDGTRKKLFQPFFTTKGADKGNGLGLSICKTIVEAHGGRIVVESEPGLGTHMSIVLPLTA